LKFNDPESIAMLMIDTPYRQTTQPALALDLVAA
jgi:hypothetical protein